MSKTLDHNCQPAPAFIEKVLHFQYPCCMSTSLLRFAATQSDIDLFTQIERNLYTAVIADSLDQLGYRNQAMREDIRPLFPSSCFAGWARTIACVDVFHTSEDCYAKEIEAVDS